MRDVTKVAKLISDAKKSLPGKIGIYYKDLVTGESAAAGEDVPVIAASVIKLFVAAEVFRQAEEGKLSLKDTLTLKKEDRVGGCGAIGYMTPGLKVTIEDLVILMLIISDNTATNMLIDLAGEEAINDMIASLGLTGTRLNRKLFDAEKASQGIQNYITAKDCGIFLEKLCLGEVVSRKVSERMLEILSDQQINHKIPYYLGDQGEMPRICHKTGEDDGITHDAAIIYGKEPYILVVVSEDTKVSLAENAFRELSGNIYHM